MQIKTKPNKHKSEWSRKAPLYLEKNDKRYKKHMSQLRQNGFSDSETWALYSVIAEFTLPRLKRFREIEVDYPSNLKNREEWNKILDKMIAYFQSVVNDDENMQNEHEQGLKWFCEYYRDLWW